MVKRPTADMLRAVWDWYQSNPTTHRLIVYFECEIVLNDYFTGRVNYK